MDFRDVRTPDGHSPDEVVSALQKEIRRGNELEAVYWAQELEGVGWSAWLWRRLEEISHEDIGLADPQCAMFVRSCREQYEHYWKTKKIRLNLALINAVVMLARAPKSRLADDLYVLVWMDPNLKFEVPDYALDKHTKRGKQLGRGLEHFLTEGALIRPVHKWANEIDQEKADWYANDLMDKWRGNPKHFAGRAWLRGDASSLAQDSLF